MIHQVNLLCFVAGSLPEGHDKDTYRMAFATGLRTSKPLLGIFLAHLSQTLLKVCSRLAQLRCQCSRFIRRVPAISGNWRDDDRDLPVGMVFPPLVCARGSHTAYGPNDTHSHLQWS